MTPTLYASEKPSTAYPYALTADSLLLVFNHLLDAYPSLTTTIAKAPRTAESTGEFSTLAPTMTTDMFH
jgi:hypothetical protein